MRYNRGVAIAPTCDVAQPSARYLGGATIWTTEEEHTMSKSKDRGAEKKKKKAPKDKTKLPTV